MVLKKQFVADVEEVLLATFKKEDFVKELSKSLAESICKKFEQKIEEISEEITEIKLEFQEFKRNVAENEARYQYKLNSLEQGIRNKNIVVFGLPEKKDEAIEKHLLDILNSKLKLNLTAGHIERGYRFGKKQRNKPRGVVITFREFKMKNKIYSMKKELKGTGLTIKEDLTSQNLKILNQAASKYGFKNVWSKNGVIYVNTNAGILTYTKAIEREEEDLDEDN